LNIDINGFRAILKLFEGIIGKAIDDLAFFRRSLEDNKRLTEDDWEYATTAYCFLFHDDYSIAIDDYHVDVECSYCDDIWVARISELTQQLDDNDHADISCPLCKRTTSWSAIKYERSKDFLALEAKLIDIISMWGYTNIDEFREKARDRIEQLIVDRRKALQSRKRKK
jgi:hypothetical protein